nr:SBBP repeat-containing protein [Bacteroidota bacterium]
NLTSFTFSSSDVFISKLDASGDFVWAKRIGGTYHDGSHSITVDNAGNVYTAGTFNSTTDFDPGAGTFYLTPVSLYHDLFVTKLDLSGNFVWAIQLGGIENELEAYIETDISGNLYITASFVGTIDLDPGPGVSSFSTLGSYDMFLLKLDPSGIFTWARLTGGTSNEWPLSIVSDTAGNTYTTGYFFDTVDFDPGPAEYLMVSTGPANIFIRKMDPSGNFIWAKQIGGAPGVGNHICLDNSGNVYVTGHNYNGTMDFDPGPDHFYLTSAGMQDAFVCRLDNDGNFNWAIKVGGTNYDNAIETSVDNSGNVYTTGYFKSTVDLDPTAGTSVFIAAGQEDLFILKLCQRKIPVITSSTNTICYGDSAMLITPLADSYLWNTGDTTQSIIISSPGNYSVLTNENGCAASSASVLINMDSTVIALDTVVGRITICGEMNNSISVLPGADSYTWSLPPTWSGSSLTNTITFLPESPGGIISVTANNACGPSNLQSFQVTVLPMPTVTYSQSPGYLCDDDHLLVLSSGSPTGGTYSGTGVTGNSFDPMISGSGTFPVVYTYSDSNSCVNSDTALITVSPCTGIEQQETENQIVLFPNPAKDKTSIIVMANMHLSMFNGVGQNLGEWLLERGRHDISLENIPPGILFLRFDSTGSQTETTIKKLILE